MAATHRNRGPRRHAPRPAPNRRPRLLLRLVGSRVRQAGGRGMLRGGSVMSPISIVILGCSPDLPPLTPYVRHPDADQLLAASSTGEEEEPPPADSDPCAGEPLCVDVSTAPFLWTFEAGWHLDTWLLSKADLNADGL